ncbi:MAG: hypothetical protein U0793_18080 [Gemmataceae bacterium]
MMKRTLAGSLTLFLTLCCLGCGGMKEKGANKEKEKPVPAEKK